MYKSKQHYVLIDQDGKEVVIARFYGSDSVALASQYAAAKNAELQDPGYPPQPSQPHREAADQASDPNPADQASDQSPSAKEDTDEAR